MDDYARKILAEGWATVARTRGVRVRTRDHDDDDDDRQTAWHQRHAQRQHRRAVAIAARREAEAQRTRQPSEPGPLATRFVDARISEALAPLHEAIGCVVAQERARHHVELERTKAAVRLLIEHIDGMVNERDTSDNRGSNIIDLPNPLRSRRHVA